MLPLDRQQRFYDISKQMARVLRRDIMEDKGSSSLKNRTLDLITNLRLETNLLNDAKNGQNKKNNKPKPTSREKIAAQDAETKRLQDRLN